MVIIMMMLLPLHDDNNNDDCDDVDEVIYENLHIKRYVLVCRVIKRLRDVIVSRIFENVAWVD